MWQHPPAWSCCSRTRAFLPALERRAAQDKPPIPLPITMASKSWGTFFAAKPCFRTLSRSAWSWITGAAGRRVSLAKGFGPRFDLDRSQITITGTKIADRIDSNRVYLELVIVESRKLRTASTIAIRATLTTPFLNSATLELWLCPPAGLRNPLQRQAQRYQKTVSWFNHC